MEKACNPYGLANLPWGWVLVRDALSKGTLARQDTAENSLEKGGALTRRTAGPAVSHASAAAVADGHRAPVDDDGNIAPAAAVPEHLVEKGGVPDDVPVVHRPSFRREGLTGLVGVGSAGFSVDDDRFCHGALPHN